MTARNDEMPSADEGDKSGLVPLQDRGGDEPAPSASSRPDEQPFRPVSQMTPREMATATAEVRRRWPRQNRYVW